LKKFIQNIVKAIASISIAIFFFSEAAFAQKNTYGLWNSYLNMVNVLEVVNNSDVEQEVTVIFNDLTGIIRDTKSFVSSPRSQVDLILNDFTGFQSDSYGVIQIVGSVRGTIYFYRSVNGAGPLTREFEYAFGVEVVEPISGVSGATFNTFQPSTDPVDRDLPVHNWQSLVNLASTSKQFTLLRYGISGTLLDKQSLTLTPFQRADVEAGHVNPGPSNVGTIKVVPEDLNAPYLSQIVRYGVKREGGGFDFALPLLGKNPESDTFYQQYFELSPYPSWLELVNLSDSPTEVILDFIYGRVDETLKVTVPANGQAHINLKIAKELIPPFTSFEPTLAGTVRISGHNPKTLISQYVHYSGENFSCFEFNTSNRLSAVFGVQHQSEPGATTIGSYNTFLDTHILMPITNITDEEIFVQATLRELGDVLYSFEIRLLPQQSRTYRLRAQRNIYGTVTLEAEKSGQVAAHIIRRGHIPGPNNADCGLVDFLSAALIK